MRFMKTGSPLLLPLLRSRSQGDILAAIFLAPQSEQSLSEIADRAGASVSTVTREVDRLEEAGLAQSRRRGNQRLVRSVTDSVVHQPLMDLLAVTFGPPAVLRDALTTVAGIERAFIYGSWAARYADRSGSVPEDIDLLVIGTPDRHELADVVAEVEKVLRREVNIRRVTPAAWAADESPFKKTVLSRPMVPVIGAPDD